MPVRFAIHIKSSKPQVSADIPDDSLYSLEGTNGASVILIHGLTGSPREMGFLARSLHKNGFSVLSPRLANHGEPIQKLRDTTWQQCYQSVKDALSTLALGANPRQGPVFVAGLSIGALFGLMLALDYPERISGVCCLSPILFYDGWNAPKWRYWLPLAYYTPLKNYFYFKEEPPYGIKNEAIRRLINQHYADKKLEDNINAYEQGYPFYPLTLLYQHHLLVKYLKKRLHLIKTPVQMIQAHHDDMSSPKNSQYIYDRIRSAKKEIFLLYNSYHVVCADQERMTVLTEMQHFFNQILEGSSRA
ncbi:MAG: alpha/beta fold hydrolase [Candidatus Omnitrophica bacterium]|nr:alpha/beta fold hydrolase [Candidatus Omnitrophota bacterium]